MGLFVTVMGLVMLTDCKILRCKSKVDKSKKRWWGQERTQLRRTTLVVPISLVCEGRACPLILRDEFWSLKCKSRKVLIISQWMMSKTWWTYTRKLLNIITHPSNLTDRNITKINWQDYLTLLPLRSYTAKNRLLLSQPVTVAGRMNTKWSSMIIQQHRPSTNWRRRRQWQSWWQNQKNAKQRMLCMRGCIRIKEQEKRRKIPKLHTARQQQLRREFKKFKREDRRQHKRSILISKNRKIH